MDLLARKKGKMAKEAQPWGHSLSTDQGDRGAMRGSRAQQRFHTCVKWAALLTTGSTLNYTEVTPDVSWKLTYCIKYISMKLQFSKVHFWEYLLKISFQYIVSKWMSYFLKTWRRYLLENQPKQCCSKDIFFPKFKVEVTTWKLFEIFENSIAPNSIHLYSCLWT